MESIGRPVGKPHGLQWRNDLAVFRCPDGERAAERLCYSHAVTAFRSRAGTYTAEAHEGVLMCAMYWHFLDGVWFVIFANLVVFG